MLTRLRKIVEKVATAVNLTVALDILVNETCLAMDTEVCSIYLIWQTIIYLIWQTIIAAAIT